MSQQNQPDKNRINNNDKVSQEQDYKRKDGNTADKPEKNVSYEEQQKREKGTRYDEQNRKRPEEQEEDAVV